ncbi:MAG: chromosomal replication initiator protein DnaA [Prevotellaceae bacterium]|jgi:chromosomal replication initiator protein|nr:chromosomal replication initiator protein DnaA [Prevotellaceae bacterium]
MTAVELYKQIWNNCLKVFKDNVSNETYRVWFAPIVPLRLNENVLTIEVPSTFFYEYLEEHYIDLLRKTLHKELGPTAKLEYSIKVTREGVPVRMPAQNRSELKNRDVAYPNMSNENRIINPFAYPGLKKLEIDPRLNKNKNFSNFIEGECNALGRSVGLEIAKTPGGTPFNPLFIWGGSGLGKTHLAHAIGIETMEKHADKVVLYVEANKFESQYTDATVRNDRNNFLNFYQMIDVLIIDDIHELAGKNKTQNTFFHIFNHLHLAGKQIILTSDKPPVELQGIEERMVSRFKCGLSIEMKKPDMETRVRILKQKIYNDGMFISDNRVIEYIASKVTTNIRELEGSLISLLAQSTIRKKEITVELAAEMLDHIVTRKKELAVKDIMKTVCDFYHLSPEQILSGTRKREIVQARQVVMYLCKKYTNHSLAVIGSQLRKDHTTVIHADKTVRNLSDTNKTFNSELKNIEKELGI